MVSNILALAKNRPPKAAAIAVQAEPVANEAAVDTQYVLIEIERLYPYDNNPFALYDGERLDLLVESIRDNGIIIPLIVRPSENGSFQILAGHNRHNAARLAGLSEVPCFVRDTADDDEALAIVLETNFAQRSITEMRPGEFAKALQLQVEMFKRKGKRNDIIAQINELMSDNCDEDENVKESENSTYSHGDRMLKNSSSIVLSDSTRRRYMRLNLLHTELLDLVDNGIITVSCGVQLSYLREFEQDMIAAFLEENTVEFDKKKLRQLRELSKENALNAQKVRAVLLEQQAKKDFIPKITKPSRAISSLFPAGTKPKTIETTIIAALKLYFDNFTKESFDETD